MSVVCVHAVGVVVLHGFMRVRVTVLSGGRRLMSVGVMAVVVPVGMLVLER